MPRDNNKPAPGGRADCMTFPVEAPLTATYYAHSGRMMLECTVMLCDPGDPGLIHLRLDFSPEATQGFAALVKAVEDQIGITLSEPTRAALEH